MNQAYCASDTVPCISLENILVEAGENEQVDALNGIPALVLLSNTDGSNTFVILKKVRAPEPKQLDEARGQITSDYQNYLEEDWIEELKAKYPVEVDRNSFPEIKL